MTEETLPSEGTRLTSKRGVETEELPAGKLNPETGKKLEPIGVSDDTAACEKNFN